MTARPMTGRKVLLALIAFFAIVAAVNAVFITLSLRTFPGVETDDAYRKGLAWDRELDAAAAQRALGWKVTVSWQSAAPASATGQEQTQVSGHITVRAEDRAGAALGGLAADITFRRAVHEGEDRHLALAETIPGLYAADVALPGSGDWRVIVRLRKAKKLLYRIDQRINVP